MKLSEQAWEKSLSIFNAIVNHPFNQELMNGTLAASKFHYYLEQDSVYSPAEVRLNLLVATKISKEYRGDFMKYAKDTEEYELWLKGFFKMNPNATLTGKVTAATMNYINHFDASALIPVEVALSKGLPCSWFYEELGVYMSENFVEDNPYQVFIDSYSGEEFIASNNRYIDIFDNMGRNASVVIQSQMIDVFYQSAVKEYRFFDDAYYGNAFDDIG
jgi:thiaminase (transcriptional activator TenA)